MKKVTTPEPEGFETLWLLWREHARKSDGRGKARSTYRKWILDGADPQDILDGARWHLRSLSDEDRKFIQLLSVYLNSEKWLDECEKERAYQERLQEQQSRASENVISIRTPNLPDNHFSKRWERGEIKKGTA